MNCEEPWSPRLGTSLISQLILQWRLVTPAQGVRDVIIIGLTESYLRPAIKDAEVKIPKYQHYRADRLERKQGGVIVYVRDDHAAGCRVMLSGSTGTVEYIVVHLQQSNVLFCCIYRPPDSQTAEFNQVLTKVNQVINSLNGPVPTIILTGDFNLPRIQWPSQTVYAGLLKDRQQAERLFQFAEEQFLEQLVDKATRNQNILDLFFTNNDELVNDMRVENTILTDHRIMILKTNVPEPNRISFKQRRQMSMRQLNFYHKKVDWPKLNEKFLKVDWESEFLGLTPDETYEVFINTLFKICAGCIPVKNPKAERGIPRDRKIIMRRRKKLNKKLLNAHGEQAKVQLTQKIDELESRLLESHRREREYDKERAVLAIKDNPKYFFSYARRKSEVKAMVGPFLKDGKIISDPKEKCEILRAQYEAMFSRPSQDMLPSDEQEGLQPGGTSEEQGDAPENPNNNCGLLDIDFSITDIEGSIKQLQESSSAGPDGVPAILLKRCSNALALPIYLLWKVSVDTETVPEKLKFARITPIYKGGSRNAPGNYRPVALTSHISKIFERVIAKRLVEHMIQHALYNPGQHGFRAGRSCLSQLLGHYHQILKLLEEGVAIDVIYLDFAKAFDKVVHKILLHKLYKGGVQNGVLAWLKSFLTGRKQVVAMEEAISSETAVVSGVPQGSVLGPVLFLIHIADIDKDIQHSDVSSFADDTRLMKAIRTIDDHGKLQNDLQTVYQWAKDNHMEFNSTKFEMLRYGDGGVNPHVYMAPDGSSIERKKQLRDLGVIMCDSATFAEQIQTMVTKARRLVGWILRSFTTRSPALMLTLFKSLVIPLLEYCGQLWNPSTVGLIRQLEGVQRTFTWKIDGMRELNYWQRLAKLKLYSLQRRRERFIILYTWKIIQGLAPNVGADMYAIRWVMNARRGRLCLVPPVNNRSLQRIQTLREGSFSVTAPRLFNKLPHTLRNYTGDFTSFKKALDKFLRTVPDQPSLPHYYQSSEGNSLTQQICSRVLI